MPLISKKKYNFATEIVRLQIIKQQNKRNEED